MKRVMDLLVLAMTGCLVAGAALASEGGKKGEALFKQHCAVCHPAGGNIVKPEMTLLKKHLESHHKNSVKAIVNAMRNPGPGMTKFDAKIIPGKDAKAIAEYILKTFK